MADILESETQSRIRGSVCPCAECPKRSIALTCGSTCANYGSRLRLLSLVAKQAAAAGGHFQHRAGLEGVGRDAGAVYVA